jgi:hypothetical protein
MTPVWRHVCGAARKISKVIRNKRRLRRIHVKKNLYERCRLRRRIVVMTLTCSLGHCECNVHTVHKFIQRRLTADWLVPRESDFSRMHSKVSSHWPPITSSPRYRFLIYSIWLDTFRIVLVKATCLSVRYTSAPKYTATDLRWQKISESHIWKHRL